MLQIVKFPNPILRERMPEFDFNNPIMDPKKLEKDLLDAMVLNGGIGLAANQVGIKTRVFVMGFRKNPYLRPKIFDEGMAFFNPIIVEVLDKIEELEEGCLSFPGIFAKVKRPTAIKVQFHDSNGELRELELRGYDCRCFLHEYDHLEGIVYQDRVSPLKWAMAVKKKRKNNVTT